MSETENLEVVIDIGAFGLKDLDNVARKLVEELPNSGVVAIHGKMGAGKTTLVKALCRILGVKDEVSSPTYGLVNIYEITGNDNAQKRIIHHIDLFRLKDEEEAEKAGIFNIFDMQGLSFVEWPERISNSLPDNVWLIKIEESMAENIDETSDANRKITLLRQRRC